MGSREFRIGEDAHLGHIEAGNFFFCTASDTALGKGVLNLEEGKGHTQDQCPKNNHTSELRQELTCAVSSVEEASDTVGNTVGN